MPRILLLFLIVPMVLFAYVDSDMDGVEDKDDLCPNTLMTDLVDLKGCTIKSLISPHHFTLLAGISYAEENNVSYLFSTLELDYYYKKISMKLSSSYYNVDDETTLNSDGLNDTTLNFFYRFNPLENLSLSVGTAVYIPTYDSSSNKMDYSASIDGRYYIDKLSLSTGVGYKIVGDTNASNTLFYHLSTGYSFNNNLYSSLSYSVSESIYEDVDNFETLSLYNYYSINKNWFGTLSLTKGISSESLDNTIGVKVGYYW